MLEKNQANAAASLTQVALLDRQIQKRKQLVGHIRAEVNTVKAQISQLEKQMAEIQDRRTALTTYHRNVLRSSYRLKLRRSRWLFLLSASSFQQAVVRWRYLSQINRSWREKLQEYKESLEELSARQAELDAAAMAKDKLLQQATAAQTALEADRRQQRSLVADLQKDEKQLKKRLQEKAKAAERLRKAIERIITGANAGKGGEKLPLTPAMAKLASSFQKNKGQLPWPVQQGIITRSYGKHRHPSLRNVTTNNNGIDINTRQDSDVRAIFQGKVVAQQSIPGHDYMVIISHGSFYSVYSYLRKVQVKVGQKVKVGTKIGQARNKGDLGEVHLEIWQGKELLDPQKWLKSE